MTRRGLIVRSMATTNKKKHVDIYGVDTLMQKLLSEKYQKQYEALDALHMNCLRDYVYEHITYKKGEKPRTKKEAHRRCDYVEFKHLSVIRRHHLRS